MQTNPFIKPIISKHNKSPFLGGKINIKVKSLSGLYNPLKQSFKNTFLNKKKMINPFKYESNYSNINYLVYEYMQPMVTPFAPIGRRFSRPRVPFLQKASSGAKVIRAKSERQILTPYHPNKKVAHNLPNWKNI